MSGKWYLMKRAKNLPYPKDMKTKPNLSGVSLARGIAVFAVVFIHSPFVDVPYEPSAKAFSNIFAFAVPFFLASAFYFYALKLNAIINWNFWQLRFQRIVVPYFSWSLIYLGVQCITFWRSHDSERLNILLSDPIGIIFLGKAAAHLYFLPLLFFGTSLVIVGDYLQRIRLNISILSILMVLSLALYKVLFELNLLFTWNQPFAFRAFLDSWHFSEPWYTLFRLILVLFSVWIICLPYLLGSMLLVEVLHKLNDTKIIQQPIFRWSLLFFCTIYLFIYIYMALTNSTSLNIWAILAAYSLLGISVFVSPYLKESRLVKNISFCSFGIYLIHQPVLFYVVRHQIISKFIPGLAAQVSILSMSIGSLLCFLLSWLLVSIMIRNKIMARYLFGI
jgi:hypothetical protein